MKTNNLVVAIFGLIVVSASVTQSGPVSLKKTDVRGAYTMTPLERAKENARDPQEVRIEAFIGRRASRHSGERSSLRWLSRLMKQHPKARMYVVEWYAPSHGKWWNVATICETATNSSFTGMCFVEARDSIENPPFKDLYWDATLKEIHKVARKGGTFRTFTAFQ